MDTHDRLGLGAAENAGPRFVGLISFSLDRHQQPWRFRPLILVKARLFKTGKSPRLCLVLEHPIAGKDPLGSIVDPEISDLLTRVMEKAWAEVGSSDLDAAPDVVHADMVFRLMAAVREGERDPARLLEVALVAQTRNSP